MKKDSNSTFGVVVVIIAFVFVVGLIGNATEKELCLHPGCDNERIEGTGACYKHGSNAPSNSYKSSGSSYSNSSYSDDDNDATVSNSSESTTNSNSSGSTYKKNNTSSSGGSTSSGKSNDYDSPEFEGYDNPDDYADDYAEDYAYDEFGYVDDETYEYGYEEAYDEWMDEAE